MRLLALLLLLAPLSARADYRIISPYEIDLGEIEIEHNGSAAIDPRNSTGAAKSYTIEVGTGITAWWHTEVELGFNRDPGSAQPTLLTQIVTENTFQLSEPGEYWADFGFYLEYAQSLSHGTHAAANELTFGPIFAKETGAFTHTLNLLFTRLLGPDQTTKGLDFTYAWQTKWNIWAPLSPAVEIYGDAGTLFQSPTLRNQQLLAGPAAIGALQLSRLGLGHAGKLKYEAGLLFGVTRASPATALRWRAEIEIPF